MNRKGVWTLVFVGLMISLIVAGFVSFYADPNPDGLERVAEDTGFIDTAADSANAGIPTADYGIAGVESERLSVGLAGLLGVVIMVIVGFGLFMWLGRGKKPAQESSNA